MNTNVNTLNKLEQSQTDSKNYTIKYNVYSFSIKNIIITIMLVIKNNYFQQQKNRK